MKKHILITAIFLITTINIFSQGFKFIAMSDSRGKYTGVNDPVLSAIVDHIIKNQADAKFVVFAGDMVGGNSKNPARTLKELEHWKKILSPIYDNPNMDWPKLWPVVGNHEIQHREDEKNFKKIFPDVFNNGPDDEKGLSYSFDYQNTHFTIINTDRWYYGDPIDTTDDKHDRHYIKHLHWLENDLREAKERDMKHTFVFSHEMAYPIGGHLRDGLPNLGRVFAVPLDSTRQWYLNRRNIFLQLLKENYVDAHICGHEHIYGRQEVNGVYQIITGSSGAPLYQFNPVYRIDADSVYTGEEMSYNSAIPHYKILNYNYGPGKNSQASRDFVGIRAFNYTVFDVQEDFVIVKTFGAYPKENDNTAMETEINLIDDFVIFKPGFFSRSNDGK